MRMSMCVCTCATHGLPPYPTFQKRFKVMALWCLLQTGQDQLVHAILHEPFASHTRLAATRLLQCCGI